MWTVKITAAHQHKGLTNDTSITTRIYNSGKLIPQLQNSTQYIPIGESVTLRCATFGDLVPIEWWFQRSSTSLANKISNHSRSIDVHGIAVDKDEGFYTCSTKVDKQVSKILFSLNNMTLIHLTTLF